MLYKINYGKHGSYYNILTIRINVRILLKGTIKIKIPDGKCYINYVLFNKKLF